MATRWLSQHVVHCGKKTFERYDNKITPPSVSAHCGIRTQACRKYVTQHDMNGGNLGVTGSLLWDRTVECNSQLMLGRENKFVISVHHPSSTPQQHTERNEIQVNANEALTLHCEGAGEGGEAMEVEHG